MHQCQPAATWRALATPPMPGAGWPRSRRGDNRSGGRECVGLWYFVSASGRRGRLPAAGATIRDAAALGGAASFAAGQTVRGPAGAQPKGSRAYRRRREYLYLYLYLAA